MRKGRIRCDLVIALLFLVLLGMNASCRAASANLSSDRRAPIQAELVQVLEAGRIKTGTPIFAKTTSVWKNNRCELRKGAIIEGRVVLQKARSKADKTSEIAIVFESGQCGGKAMKPLPLTLAAVVASDPTQSTSLFDNQESPPLADAVGLGLNGDSVAATGNGMRSVTAAAQTMYYEPTHYKAPRAVMPGEVVGISHVKLGVGTGPQGSSVLSSEHQNVRLESGSQFVLVPNLYAATEIGSTREPNANRASSISHQTESNVPRTTSIADTTEICAPPECSVVLPTTNIASEHNASFSLPIQKLGYLPWSSTREMNGFTYSSAITYLGPNEILFTFSPRILVRRNTNESVFREIRIIRGVLINLKTSKVMESVDWRVPDSGQYLWPLDGGRVLVHVGDDLRVYGPGLKQTEKIPLDGPLSFVRISPSGKYFAIGVIHERHTPEMHRQLEQAEGREPEEDVNIRVMNETFRTLTSVVRSSWEAPPVLMDEGEIRIPSIGANRWRLVEYSWAGQRRVLAEVNSTCVPEAKSIPHDLLFLVGCDRQAAGKWYRALRENGTPVLKGWSPASDLEHIATGSPDTNAFAVETVSTYKSLPPDAYFYRTDLESQEIVLYQSGNGQRLFSVKLSDPLPTFQSFAFSPAGDQIAVLRSGEIQFFAVSRSGSH